MPKKKQIENYIIRDKLQEYLDVITQSHKAEPDIIRRHKIINQSYLFKHLLKARINATY